MGHHGRTESEITKGHVAFPVIYFLIRQIFVGMEEDYWNKRHTAKGEHMKNGGKGKGKISRVVSMLGQIVVSLGKHI